MKGVDISQWNGIINWNILKKAGVEFAILRAGYGNSATQIDQQFKANVKGAKAAGIPIGVYWFSYAMSVIDAKKEADICISILKECGADPTIGVWFDWEDDSLRYAKANGTYPTRSDATSYALAFIDRVESKGYKGGLYSNLNYLRLFFDASKFERLWVAAWGSSKPSYNKMVMWQYTDNWVINGVRFDGNYMYKSVPSPSPSPSKIINVVYRVKTNNGWLPAVRNLTDYAGDGTAIHNVAIKVSKGKVKYRVHVIGTKSGWLPYVTGYDINDVINGYAGNDKNIDAIEIIYTSPAGEQRKIKYRVAPVGKNYYDWQIGNAKSNTMDGYAGAFGVPFGKLQIAIV